MHETLRKQSLGKLGRLFSTLRPPPPEMRSGFYRGEFIGPWWLRLTGPYFVGMTGLPGWQGKRFLTPEQAANVIVKRKVRCDGPVMQWVTGKSQLDGQAGAALCYAASAPMPWRWVSDEVRAVDSHTILGMTVVNLPLLKRIGFPFLLVREP